MAKYIHYGSTQLRKIDPISNERHWTKPVGGLWASPIDSPYNWKVWCKDNGFMLDKLEQSFSFDLTDDARIMHIYSVDDLSRLPKLDKSFTSWTLLDFEKISQDYDGIELHLSQEKKTIENFLHGLYFQLYGWDCDSILIFNDKIIKIEE